MIADQGALNETSTAKLLLAIYEQSQTGILHFRQNEILKVFYLNRGKISWAISSDEEDKIDHVLLDKKLVTPEVLAPYQTGNKIGESFGKVLVENGIITLEALIQATREQVHRIAAGVLRWRSGSYQLVQDPPPTRMVSLDVDIPSLVTHFVLAQMDVNIVWEELGSLSGELQQNSDPWKKSLYSLNPEQQGIYSRFRQPQRLETVLQDFPSEGKYRILKILYYFLLTGLLSRKEPEPPPSLDFKELDSLFIQAPANASAEVDINMPAMIDEDEDAVQNIPLADFAEVTVGKEAPEETELPALPDLMPPDSMKEPETEPSISSELKEERERPHPFLVPEQQKPRWLSMLFISILLAAVLLGLFLWLSRSPAAPGKSEAKPGLARERTKTAAPMKTMNLPQGSDASGAGSAAATKEPVASAEAVKPAAEKAAPAASKPGPILSASGPSARERFAAGDFRAAGAAWRDEIVSQQ
ncbi:MAG: DUF4388 domain-containing protein, partial [Acidobacteriota bacterium]|nr:DUF4388 domain-containing protein [Acidobacteriota bacterium]